MLDFLLSPLAQWLGVSVPICLLLIIIIILLIKR